MNGHRGAYERKEKQIGSQKNIHPAGNVNDKQPIHSIQKIKHLLKEVVSASSNWLLNKYIFVSCGEC